MLKRTGSPGVERDLTTFLYVYVFIVYCSSEAGAMERMVNCMHRLEYTITALVSNWKDNLTSSVSIFNLIKVQISNSSCRDLFPK
jgi:hypothetical protein